MIVFGEHFSGYKGVVISPKVLNACAVLNGLKRKRGLEWAR